MRCTNQGSDYQKEDIQWSCTASLPEEFKLGSTEVTCEGYSSSSDEFVLKGSCGVEYKLLFTEKGEERFGSGGYFEGDGDSSPFAKTLFLALFFGVGAWILWSMYQAYRNGTPNGTRPARRPPGVGGGGFFGGGGGGGGFDDPPPPYPGSGPGKRYTSFSSTRPQQEQGFRPGFWSGALGGAAAGYMAGNRGAARQQQPMQQQGGGWFGGGGGYGSGEGSSSGTRRSNSGSTSGVRHESTGFGSTSRR